MQIQYCDGCSTRIDEAEAVKAGDLVYCKACAETKVPKVRAGASGLHPGARAPSARSSPGAGMGRRSPPSGSQAVSAGQRPSSPRVGTATRMASVAPQQSASASTDSSAATESSGKMVIWALAAAGLILAGLGVVLMTRSAPASVPPKTDNADPKAAAKADARTDTKTGTADEKTARLLKPVTTPDTKQESPRDVETGVAIGRPSLTTPNTEMEDFREGFARRELDKIIEYEKSGKRDAFELYKRYDRYVSNHGSTKAGKEAQERMKALPPIANRKPENPASTSPGLEAKCYEKDPGDIILAKKSEKDFRFKHTKTAGKIDFSKEKLKELAGRDTDIVLYFTGYVQAPADGVYNFYTASDDGSLLYIGDSLVVNNDSHHPQNEIGEAVPLAAGKHKFKLVYYQGGGDAGLNASWSGPGVAKQRIPASAFSH